MTAETSERIWCIWEKLMQEVSGDQPYPQTVNAIKLLLHQLVTAFEAVGTREQTLTHLATIK